MPRCGPPPQQNRCNSLSVMSLQTLVHPSNSLQNHSSNKTNSIKLIDQWGQTFKEYYWIINMLHFCALAFRAQRYTVFILLIPKCLYFKILKLTINLSLSFHLLIPSLRMLLIIENHVTSFKSLNLTWLGSLIWNVCQQNQLRSVEFSIIETVLITFIILGNTAVKEIRLYG